MSTLQSVLYTYDPPTPAKTPAVPQARRLLYRRINRSILIILFQSALLCTFWSFYFVTRRNAITISPGIANAYYAYGTETFTFVRVIQLFDLRVDGELMFESSLYSLSIRHLLVMHLAATPTSAFAVTSSIKVAGRAPLMNFAKPLWTFASILCAIALGAQTAGWATVLTPQPITLESRIIGTELDASNADFIALSVGASLTDPETRLDYTNDVPLLEASGAALINVAMMGRPATINYSNMSFYGRTGGVLPAYLYDTSSSVDTSRFIPALGHVIDPPTRIPTGLPRNYTVTQQGLSANIACVQQDLTPTTSPSWSLHATEPVDAVPAKIIYWMSTTCPSGAQSNSTYGLPFDSTGVPNTVYYAVCESDTGNSIVIIQGSGTYNWIPTSVCTVAPYITTVDVTYSPVAPAVDRDLIAWPGMAQVGNWDKASFMPSAGIVPLRAMQIIFYSAQSTTSHAIGNYLSAFHNFSDPTAGLEITDVLATYLTGFFESSATILRATYSQTNNTLLTNLQADMFIPLNGTFVTETLGWKSSTTTPISMIPSTIIMLISIILVIITLSRFRGRIEDGLDNFDPANAGHIIAAASAGGLDHIPFSDFAANRKDQFDMERRIRIQLGQTTRGLGFFAVDIAAAKC
ncbi:hypothetical protein BDN72DRAFT_905215 [Pluteus cervinus]|uniref:Uncharacterized protein n=1 Tax=Pluteus cervinus TaxID=181527 RepID=A0ACD3A4E1_9AGAR|nr:hypothetical protein BDN72DRAFT_905215 [Pluteus cervinus]